MGGTKINAINVTCYVGINPKTAQIRDICDNMHEGMTNGEHNSLEIIV